MGGFGGRVGRPLAVHVVLHEERATGTSPAASFAGELYSRLTRAAGASGVPVGIWAAAGKGDGTCLPPMPDLTTAARNAVVVLVDQDFFDARRTWATYVETLAARLEGRDLLLPVTMLGNAHLVSPALRDVNHVPVSQSDGGAWDEGVFNAVLTALVRLLPDGGEPPDGGPSPPRAFLCHAKSDGHGIASELRRHIYERTQLTCFFDANDIPHGEGVRQTIEASIARSCLLVVWTDRLLESRWCQYEIMEARRRCRPIVVLDALTVGAPRVFPFLGNMPVIRWDGDPERVLGAMLIELLRSRHVRALFDALGGQEAEATDFVPHPPDLVEAGRTGSVMVDRDRRGSPATRVTVYPDPPLGTEELSFLGDLFADRRLCSLSEWVALRAVGALEAIPRAPAPRSTPFAGLSVGLSLSETEAWRSLGMTPGHLDDISVETARQLILLGSRLVWGGDLRPGGLGGRLEALVRAYHQADRASQDHVACYLAWPTYRAASEPDLAERRAFAEVRCLPCPAPAWRSPAALDAMCYSLMRREVAAACDARVVLGGKLDLFGGRYPGVLEEAVETVALGRPLYVVGGFGGAAAAVYEAITSPEATTLRRAWAEHCERPGVRDAQVAYDELGLALGSDLRVEHDEVLRLLSDLGPRGLSASNGLSPGDNERLARSRDLHEVLALIVGGLARSRAAGPASSMSPTSAPSPAPGVT